MTKPCLLITFAPPPAVAARLAEVAEIDFWAGSGPMPRQELLQRVAQADALLCLLTDKVDTELLQRAPRLRAVSTVSVGLDHIDLAAAGKAAIAVGHTPGVLVDATADLAFALLLAAARRVAEADAYVRAGHWQTAWSPQLMLGKNVAGASLGIIGLGAIGRAVAQRARGFGMQVLGWNRSPVSLPGVQQVELADLYARSDFVSVNVALTDSTRGLVGTQAIAAMRDDAVLVNTARGGIVDEVAVAGALHNGTLGAYASDVFGSEPIAADNPLLGAPNTVLLPHIGSATQATRAAMLERAVDNLLAFIAGLPMPFAATNS